MTTPAAGGLITLVSLLPLKLQVKAKAIAALVATILSATLPILHLVGVPLPTEVTAGVSIALALLIPLSVYAVPNIPAQPTPPPTSIPLAQD